MEVVLLEDRYSQFVACTGNHLNEEHSLNAGGQSQKDPEEYSISELGDKSPLRVITRPIKTARRHHFLVLCSAARVCNFRFLGRSVSGVVVGSFFQLPAVGERRPFQRHHRKLIASGCDGGDADVTSIGGVFPLPLCVLCPTSGLSGESVTETLW